MSEGETGAFESSITRLRRRASGSSMSAAALSTRLANATGLSSEALVMHATMQAVGHEAAQPLDNRSLGESQRRDVQQRIWVFCNSRI
jgi:hypothetical protein